MDIQTKETCFRIKTVDDLCLEISIDSVVYNIFVYRLYDLNRREPILLNFGSNVIYIGDIIIVVSKASISAEIITCDCGSKAIINHYTRVTN